MVFIMGITDTMAIIIWVICMVVQSAVMEDIIMGITAVIMVDIVDTDTMLLTVVITVVWDMPGRMDELQSTRYKLFDVLIFGRLPATISDPSIKILTQKKIRGTF